MARKSERWLSMAITLALVGCGPSSTSEDDLARVGEIDRTAPIVADQSIEIDASDAVIWNLISGIGRWPEWQPTIKSSELHGPVAVGTTFDWNNDGTAIRSTIAMVQPYRVLAWTGTAFGLKAIHVWKLLPSPNGHVTVQTLESMRGFPASLFYSSSELRQANAEWLRALKAEARR